MSAQLRTAPRLKNSQVFARALPTFENIFSAEEVGQYEKSLLWCARRVYGHGIFRWNRGAGTFRGDEDPTKGVDGDAGIPQAGKEWDAARQDRKRVRDRDARCKVALVLFWAGFVERQTAVGVSYRL